MNRRKSFALIGIALMAFFATLTVLPNEADARMGRKSSFGSFGKSMKSTPRKSTKRFSGGSAQRSNAQQQNAKAADGQKGSGMRSALMGGAMGLMLGGLMGAMMAGGGLGGLLMLLLVGGGIFLLMRFLKSRKQGAAVGQGAGMGRQEAMSRPTPSQPAPSQPAPPQATSMADVTANNLTATLAAINQQDPAFNQDDFIQGAKACYTIMQGSWSNYDKAKLEPLLTEAMLHDVDTHVSNLSADGEVNVIEQIQFNNAELIEGWQEMGQDYLTVRFDVSLVEYVKNTAGDIIDGDAESPQQVSDDWTFVRASNSKDPNWKLTAIQQS
uniref:Tim44-like domain-containing protein n=1 Tax=Magnetococcus massalia (strain MO-1) TaxID=451514 RepID=A0A1S7LLZ1_MAGMO|nr:Protein of unknown function. Import inner membrane translocase, subunit Tim44 [Candidatus Magnetococcus massalia]